jgi:pantoate kinase
MGSYRAFLGAIAGAALLAVAHSAKAWEMAHANSSNTGFVDVITQPAGGGIDQRFPTSAPSRGV